MAILVMEFQVPVYKLGWFLPKSEQVQRKVRYFLKWNNAESTKIGPMFIK
jgi:hypothetical protein